MAEAETSRRRRRTEETDPAAQLAAMNSDATPGVPRDVIGGAILAPGLVLITIGAGVVFGAGWAAIVLGVLLAAIGVLIGLG